ncbi:hypothetical protein D3C72_2134850 [compost metagenome]
MRLRHRLTASFSQQHRPASNSQFRAGDLEVAQPAHASRHDQRVVGGAPEQHATFAFATADGGQQFLLGVQALFDAQGQGLIGH